MLTEALIGYLAPKVIQYLFSHLKEWAEPVAKGVGCKVINFASDAYEKNRLEVEKWVRNMIPGERFDDAAVKALNQIVIFSMQEIAAFIECEIKLHGLNVIEALERAEKASQIPVIFEKIADKVTQDVNAFAKNF